METAVVVPDKPASEFRVYTSGTSVEDHYRQMRTHQNLAFSRRMVEKWGGSFGARPNSRLTVKEALMACDSFVDRSDPDTTLPNSVHMLQAAEACRAAGKPEWLQLCALLHDIGKLMHLWGSPAEGSGGKATDPQWALGGDTWVVGAPIPDCAVFPHLNALNADAGAHPGPTGIYAPRCGIMSVEFAWGHDEYAYLWARHNKVPLPPEGFAILRLHSCYPWHTGKAYRELMAPGDEALEAAVIDFNQFDLYTKASSVPVLEDVWPHYRASFRSAHFCARSLLTPAPASPPAPFPLRRGDHRQAVPGRAGVVSLRLGLGGANCTFLKARWYIVA
jgi:inositol oxygenase